jgi:hypothetical protein
MVYLISDRTYSDYANQPMTNENLKLLQMAYNFERLKDLLHQPYQEFINPKEILASFVKNLRLYRLLKAKVQYCGSITDVEYVKRAWLW